MFSKKLTKLSLSLSLSCKRVNSCFHRNDKNLSISSIPRFRVSAGFTLIELLIVIAILAILATITLLVINPVQMIKQSRDANRITELNQIDKALLIFQSFSGTGMGTVGKVYVSLPSAQADCSDLGLPALGGGYAYVCSNSTNYRKIDGTGWIPVDLTSVQSSSGSLFFALPIDPVNTAANGYYYTYIPGSWALSATMESTKYIDANAAMDGGQKSARYELGNEMALNTNLGTDANPATTPTNIVLAVGSSAPVGGVTNVSIPAAGATDTTGAVTGWVTTTADKIKFTVTDGGSAASTITIGGGAYTSGANYTIPSTSNLSIVVTTTESGKATGTRTFTVTVAAAATVPGVPTIGTATAGNVQASVTFTAPASDGGSTITGYTVTSSPGSLTGTGSASPIIVTGLTNGTAYTFTVTATNAVGTGSASGASNSVTPDPPYPDVGGEWVLVPGSLSLGTSDFYVMKYEAKNVGGVATSQEAVTPWTSISQTDSVAACSALGSGYHLPTIAEAQTINRNIEAQAANWADGIIGSLVSDNGGLKRGNVGITDSASYDGSNPDYGAPSADRILKAKLVLSNEAEIWDWAGNVWEWIYGAGADGTLGTPGGVTFYTGGWVDWNNAVLNEERPILGPSNASYTSLYGVGKYYGGATTNGLIWGGVWSSYADGGVFTFTATIPTTFANAIAGFRCSK